MTTRCLITTLALPKCDIRANVDQLAGLLAQCPALTHLDLRSNSIPQEGACELASVLGQCSALTHLNLGDNSIGVLGTGRLAGVLAKCASLSHLDLSQNAIGFATLEIIEGVLVQCTALTHLNLSKNYIGNRRAVQSAGSPRSRLQFHQPCCGRKSWRSAGAVPSSGLFRSYRQ